MNVLQRIKEARKVQLDKLHQEYLNRLPTPQPIVQPMPQVCTGGLELISQERTRQQRVEGHSVLGDQQYAHGELTCAGIAYAEAALAQALEPTNGSAMPDVWPWGSPWWKPSPDPIRNLAKAGALIAAEIDRLQHLEAKK